MAEQNTTKEPNNVSKSELSDLLVVSVCGGKYTLVQDRSGRVVVKRYGEEWRDCTGDGFVLALAQEVVSLKALVKIARDAYIEENADGETDCVTPYDRYS